MWEFCLFFLGNNNGKTHFETKGSGEKTVHAKAAQIKKEIIRKMNKKTNATSTRKAVQARIKRKSVAIKAANSSDLQKVLT